MNLAVELAKSGEAIKSGPWGLAMVLVLCVACYFLFKSMSKHLKNVRENFPAAGAASEPASPAAVTPMTAIEARQDETPEQPQTPVV